MKLGFFSVVPLGIEYEEWKVLSCIRVETGRGSEGEKSEGMIVIFFYSRSRLRLWRGTLLP